MLILEVLDLSSSGNGVDMLLHASHTETVLNQDQERIQSRDFMIEHTKGTKRQKEAIV